MMAHQRETKRLQSKLLEPRIWGMYYNTTQHIKTEIYIHVQYGIRKRDVTVERVYKYASWTLWPL